MFDKVKQYFEEIFAEAISKIVDPSTPELKNRNSYVASQYPSPLSRIESLENQLFLLIGAPDKWVDKEEKPISIFQFPWTFTKQGDLYVGLTPSIQAKEMTLNREMIGNLGNRAPPLTTGAGFDQDEEFHEKKTAEQHNKEK